MSSNVGVWGPELARRTESEDLGTVMSILGGTGRSKKFDLKLKIFSKSKCFNNTSIMSYGYKGYGSKGTIVPYNHIM